MHRKRTRVPVHSSAKRHGCQRHHPRSHPPPSGQVACLSAQALAERLEEEINRAGRHGTPLSCLLVVVDNLEELAREHGGELPEQVVRLHGEGAAAASCAGSTGSAGPATNELLLLLPGADGPAWRDGGEDACSTGCARSRSKPRGCARPLRISVGLAAWRGGRQRRGAADADARGRHARGQGEEAADLATATPLDIGSPPALGRPRPS